MKPICEAIATKIARCIKQGNFVAVGLGDKKCGFVSYEVAVDGTMNGKWGGYGSTDVGTETAKKR